MIIKPKNIIIIGGNAAGPAAAAKAKRFNPNANIMLFEKSSFISTGTCELPYLISEEVNDYRNIIFFDDKSFFDKKGVEVFVNHKITAINKKSREIIAFDLINKTTKKVNYDSLILCTGSRANVMNSIPNNVTNGFTLKNVDDYLKIKSYLDKNDVKQVVIFGAGYIGLEVAEAFKKKVDNVLIIEKSNEPLPSAEPETRKLIHKLLQSKGIDFIGGISDPIMYFKENKLHSINIDSRLIHPDIFIVATGVAPNVDLALASSLEIGKTGAIKVDTKQRTTDSFIYSAGDNTEVINQLTNKPMYLPLATNAHTFAHIAGINAAGGNEYSRNIIKNIALRLFNFTYTSIGLNSKEIEDLRINSQNVMASAPNIIKVMPNSGDIFAKIIYEKNNKNILGAEFFGVGEVTGYANIISMMIQNKIKIEKLKDGDFNYTPALSPFVNILSILGRKIK